MEDDSPPPPPPPRPRPPPQLLPTEPGEQDGESGLGLGLGLELGVATSAPTATGWYVPSEQEVTRNLLGWLLGALVLLLVFGVLRHHAPRSVVLRRRLKSLASRSLKGHNFLTTTLRHIYRTLTVDHAQLLLTCGFDAFLTLRLVRLSLHLLVGYTAVGMLFLLPVYYAQAQTLHCEKYCSHVNASSDADADAYAAECVCFFIDKCSMANLDPGSHSLWAPVLVVYVFTFMTQWALRREYVHIVRLRQMFWLSRPPQVYSIYVDNIPRSLRGAPQLRQYFNRIFPDQVFKVEMMGPIATIKRLAEERNRAVALLERAKVLELEEPGGRAGCGRATGPASGCCAGFERLSSAEHYEAELERLSEAYDRAKREYFEKYPGAVWREVNDHDRAVSGNGSSDSQQVQADEAIRPRSRLRHAFVTFRTAMPASIAAQSIVHDEDILNIRAAPEPRDVRWDLVSSGTAVEPVQLLRRLCSQLLFLVVVLFWGVITSFVGALTSTEAIAKQLPELNKFFLDHPEFVQWLDRLSALIYVILISLVWPILSFLAKMDARVSESNVERAAAERYFTFLVVQVFVFYSVAGTVFKTLVEIIDRPGRIVSTLASTIPKNAAFYITFIAVKVFWLVFDMARGYDVIFFVLRRVWFGKTVTERERRTAACGCCFDISYPSSANLASTNANLLLVFFISCVYSPLQPWLLPISVAYFVVALVSMTTRFSLQQRQMYDGGGTSWTHMYWCFVAAQITCQLTLAGTLLTKDGIGPAFLVLVLAGVTMLVSSRTQASLRGVATDMSIEVASELDSAVLVEAQSQSGQGPDGATTPLSTARMKEVDAPQRLYNLMVGVEEDDEEVPPQDDEELAEVSPRIRSVHGSATSAVHSEPLLRPRVRPGSTRGPLPLFKPFSEPGTAHCYRYVHPVLEGVARTEPWQYDELEVASGGVRDREGSSGMYGSLP